MNERLVQMLLVGAGGFLGANARYLLGLLATAHLGTRFPFATVFINVSGSFLLGLVGTLAAERWIPNPEPFRLLLGVGFLGAFTTFSTFEYENHALLQDGQWLLAGLNFVLSPVLGYLAVWLGVMGAQAWRG
jgi:CrcB protein